MEAPDVETARSRANTSVSLVEMDRILVRYRGRMFCCYIHEILVDPNR